MPDGHKHKEEFKEERKEPKQPEHQEGRERTSGTSGSTGNMPQQPSHYLLEKGVELQRAFGNQAMVRRLANFRSLLDDTRNLIEGKKREGLHEDLLDTTYENVGDNLILDINMEFEEHLQREIEHDSYFTEQMKEVVKTIHNNLNIESIRVSYQFEINNKQIEDDNITENENNKKDFDYKGNRIKYIVKLVSEHMNVSVDVDNKAKVMEFLTKLRDAEWNPRELNQIPDKETRRKVMGYVKLLKMLDSQYPLFGGSTEYERNEQNKLEYWVYHMSTLTKDPQRQYSDERSTLVKPMRDYRTYRKGKVPHRNQRNLGTGIVELKWDEIKKYLPMIKATVSSELRKLREPGNQVDKVIEHRKETLSMINTKKKFLQDVKEKKLENLLKSLWGKSTVEDRKAMLNKVFNIPSFEKNILNSEWEVVYKWMSENKDPIAELYDPTNPSVHALYEIYAKHEQAETVDYKKLQQLWDNSSEDQRKAIFGGVLRLPWSDAHKQGLLDKTPENVVGVLGNVLETPAKARERYEMDLQKMSGESGFGWNLLQHEDGDEELDKDKIIKEFVDKHKKWYDDAKKHHKPIIGGISGHTLGYLNLYEEALKIAKEKFQKEGEENAKKKAEENAGENAGNQVKNPQELPAMETLRAIMLGALIGAKQHHSYDEVMTASHGIPDHGEGGNLEYKFPDSYKDVLDSNKEKIKNAAEKAREKTKKYVNDPKSNSVLDMVKNKVYAGDPEGFQNLRSQTEKYINEGFEHGKEGENVAKISDVVTKRVKALVDPPKGGVQEKIKLFEQMGNKSMRNK